MHDISMLAQRLKTEIIKPTINSFIKKKRKEEDLNLSKLSNISRITSSSYRRDLVKTKTMKEKKAIVTQLVEINLENGKSSLIRKIKSTETKLTNMDDFTCSNQQQNIKDKMIKKASQNSSPLKKIDKKALDDQKKIILNLNNRHKINSNILLADSKTKQIASSGNVITSTPMTNKKIINKSKLRDNNNIESKAKLKQNNQEVDKIYKISFKKPNKNNDSNAKTMSCSENETFLNSIIKKDSINTFQNDKNQNITYKLEPRSIKNNINMISKIYSSCPIINNCFSMTEEGKNHLNDKIYNYFKDIKNKTIFEKIFNFLKKEEKGKLKNFNLLMRKIFFENEINVINKKISLLVNLEENPLSKLELPKQLISKVSSSSLILSNYYEKLKTVSSYKCLVDILFIRISNSSENNEDIPLKSKIDKLESQQNNKNIYYFFETRFIDYMKRGGLIYRELSRIQENDNQALCFQDLPKEFGPFVEFFFIIRKIISQDENNIELQILSKKLQILMTYYGSI